MSIKVVESLLSLLMHTQFGKKLNQKHLWSYAGLFCCSLVCISYAIAGQSGVFAGGL